MKYLSDLIIISVPISVNYINQYVPYILYTKQCIDGAEDRKEIFRGRIFCQDKYKVSMSMPSGSKKDILLIPVNVSDLARNYSYNFEYMKPNVYGNYFNYAGFNSSNQIITDNKVEYNPSGVIQKFEIEVESKYIDNEAINIPLESEPVSCYYRLVNEPINKPIYSLTITGQIPTGSKQIYNLLTQHTDILPHLPSLSNVKDEKINMFFGGLLYANNLFNTIGAFKLFSRKKGAITSINEISFINENNIGRLFSFNISKSEDLKLLLDSDTEILSASPNISLIKLGDFNDDYNKDYYLKDSDVDLSHLICDIAVVDKCPAEYYIMWVDRTGAFQSQPFSKRNIMSYDVESLNTVDYQDTNRTYRNSVNNSWNLNSEWLTEEQYLAYESLLVAPYAYLYDTQKNEGTQVNCKTSHWDQKTNKNQGKLFNLNLTVEVSRNQIMLF